MNKIINVLAAIAVGVAAVAAQAGDNPREPGYFWGKVAAGGVEGAGERYVDARNPLTPSFYVKGEWQGAAAGEAYVDSRNPTHPMYKKF